MSAPNSQSTRSRGTRAEAQARIDQIHSFRRELSQLQAEGVAPLSAEQQQAIDAYHATLSQELSEDYDVDPDLQAKQLSLGMRIDAHGRLVAPPPSAGGMPMDLGPDEDGQEIGE